MDEETFWLLMQLMFGNHHQRQKANFKLRRKGVPNKLRLKAKHKGPGARLSLKQALSDAISKYEFEQRHSQPTASAFSTHTAQNHNYDSFAKPQSGRSSAGPPQIDPHAPMRSQGMISQYEPNFWGKIQKKIGSSPFLFKFFGNIAYDMADNAYVSFLSLQRGRSRVNLAGEVVTGSRITDAGVNTLINAFSTSFFSPKFLGSFFELKGLNAAQFSKMFKGTFIARLEPGTRGFVNRMFNKIYTKRQIHLIKKGLLFPSKAAGEKVKGFYEEDSTKHVFDEPLR